MFVITIFSFCSCQNNSNSNIDKNENTTKDISKIKYKIVDNRIDEKDVKILKSMYVISRNKPKIREQANKNAQVLGNFEYGEKLNVIEETKDWYGVAHDVTRDDFRDGTKMSLTYLEKVYILKSETGNIDKINILPSELQVMYSLTRINKTNTFEKLPKLNTHLDIEIIDKAIFDNKRKNAINYFSKYKSVIKKSKGVITVKGKNEIVIFIDELESENLRLECTFIGKFDFLNTYLIDGSYLENQAYRFIDLTSWKNKKTFNGYPYVSTDKRHIICISKDNDDYFDSTADLSLYTLENEEIHQKMKVSFKNWIPADSENSIFWSDDNYLYMTINYVIKNEKDTYIIEDKIQYIRIHVL